MIYSMEGYITEVMFLTNEAKDTVRTCEWAYLDGELDYYINSYLGDAPTPEQINEFLENGRDNFAEYLGYDSWDDIAKIALRNMEQKC